MLTEPLAASAANSCAPLFPSPLNRSETTTPLGAALMVAREELARLQGQGNSRPSALREAANDIAQAVTQQPRPNRRDPWVPEVLSLLKEMRAVGLYDLAAPAEIIAQARADLANGWTGLLAGMLRAAPWELNEAPALAQVPDWLWGDYVAWLFYSPPRFVAANVCPAQQRTAHLGDLECWVGRNAGSAAVRAAIASYLEADKLGDCHTHSAVWRKMAEVRGRMLSRVHVRGHSGYDPVVAPRHGRRLRLGFIARDLGPDPDVFSALPCFEQLDPKAFEVLLFSLSARESSEATYCARFAHGTHLLPEGTPERVKWLRSALLDVAVFVGDLGRGFDELAELALHRVAVLQVANHRTGFTTGLPEIDLYVAGTELTAEAATAFTERIGVLGGPSYSIAFAGAANEPVTASRADIGIPPTCTALFSFVDAVGASPSTIDAWARILSRNANAHLVIAVGHDAADFLVTRFCAAIDRALLAHGVESNRVTVFPMSVRRPHELRALLALSDVHLDANAGRHSSWAVAEALRAGVPVIALKTDAEGGESAAMLHSLGVPDLVAPDSDSYVQLATSLCSDVERAAFRDRIAAAIDSSPDFLDVLAASDAFGALIEAAFDELASLGRTEFRRQLDPIRCFRVDDPKATIAAGLAAFASGDVDTAAMEAGLALRSAPADADARHLQGLVLHAQGDVSRAVDYLLAAVQHPTASAAIWYALARALRDNRQISEAIQALETCIRIDNRHRDALFMLLELAEGAGAAEIARDILQCLQQVAPDDPRVMALS